MGLSCIWCVILLADYIPFASPDLDTVALYIGVTGSGRPRLGDVESRRDGSGREISCGGVEQPSVALFLTLCVKTCTHTPISSVGSTLVDGFFVCYCDDTFNFGNYRVPARDTIFLLVYSTVNKINVSAVGHCITVCRAVAVMAPGWTGALAYCCYIWYIK